MTEAMVQASGLRKVYRRSDGADIEAVKGIDITIHKGEIFSLLGPNGAGKTTMISMISGLVEPTEGDALISGHSIRKDPLAAKQLMGIVPQEIALYPRLSARRNLEFFGQMYGMRGKDLSRRVDEVLGFVDLTDRQHDRVDTFSGGMKRRVNIAAGLLHKPQLVYMDEPTVGIDPQNRRRILDMVYQLRDEYGMTVLYTTHYMEEAQELSDRVGIIDHGEIIALGTQEELTQQVGEEDRLVFSLGQEPLSDELLQQAEQVEGVQRVVQNVPSPDSEDAGSPVALTLFADDGRKVMSPMIRLLNDADVEISSVEVREPDLEALFLHLTGRALRDG